MDVWYYVYTFFNLKSISLIAHHTEQEKSRKPPKVRGKKGTIDLKISPNLDISIAMPNIPKLFSKGI